MKLRLFYFVLLFQCYPCKASIWEVGPAQTYTYCSQVAPLVQAGDTVKIYYAIYINDPQVLWNKNNLYIVGVGGRPRLQAGSIIANDNVNGKGIFVISGSNVRVENIEFANAVVVDHNGAGVRQEGAGLIVSGCKFESNEMGILQGGTIPNCTILIEYCEFVNNGSSANPGYQHNVYINHIDTLIFRYNFSYDAAGAGHELKSRASNNYILYNRIANYLSIDSRNIDLPNGGTVVLLGNVIEQGPNSQNSNIIGYGLEGLSNQGPHNVWIANNTLVNKKSTGSFIHIAGGTDTLFIKNNILAGAKTGGLIIGNATSLDSSNNIIEDNISNCGFVNTNSFDYHLLSSSIAVDAGLPVSNVIGGYQLQADKEYKDTCDFENRTASNNLDIGAFEYKALAALAGLDEKIDWSVYPSPSSGYVFINFPYTMSKLSVQVYNMRAVLIKEVSVKRDEAINTSDMGEGLYFIRIKEHPQQTHFFIIGK